MKRLINDGESDNYQLMALSKKYKIPLRKIAFKDQLEAFEPVPGAYIINMQDSTKGYGTHWVGLYLVPRSLPNERERENIAYYFDSYGEPPPEAVIRFSKKYADDLAYSRDQIQGLNTDHCGAFVMNWLTYMGKGKGDYGDRYVKFLDLFKTIRSF